MKKGKVIFWIILGLVIVGVVLAILFVTLFGNKSTEDLAKNLNSYSTSEGYLSETSEKYQKVDTYFDDLATTITDDTYRNEIANFKNAYTAYTIISDFFNNEIYYMTYNDVYKENRSQIENSFKNAQTNIDKMIDQINKNSKAVGDSEFWKKQAWKNCRDYMKTAIKETATAFKKIMKVYNACVASNIINNDYSKIIFFGLEQLISDFDKKYTEDDTVGQKILNYSTYYFTDTTKASIIEYTYTTNLSLKNKVSNILSAKTESAYFADLIGGSL